MNSFQSNTTLDSELVNRGSSLEAVIMISVPLLGNALGGPGWGMFCFFLGFILAWLL